MVSRLGIHRALAHFPLWPLLTGVILGVCLGDSFGTDWWAVLSVFGALLAITIRKLPLTLFIVGSILGHGTHGRVIDHQQTWVLATTSSDSTESHHPKIPTPTIHIQGVVLDTGSRKRGPYLVKITHVNSANKRNLPQLPTAIKIILTPRSMGETNLLYGEKIEAEGALQRIEPNRNPYGFDRARWRHRQGADLTLTSYHPIILHGVSPSRQPIRTMIQWKKQLREKMTAGLAPDSEAAQLIRAVVLGERPPRPSVMIDDFRNSGTLHVFAVSGLHVGMVGSILALLFWLSRAPRWLIITLTIIGMALYAGITGLRPPAIRAVIMASVFLSGFLFQRRPTLINSLAVSAIIVLIWDGHQFFTPGFQLTYGVLLAIALLTRFWSSLLKPIATLDPFMPRLLLTPWQERQLTWREKLQGALAVSSAAWVGSTPLMWLHFGIATPIAILAGIPLMLLVFFILALAMFSMAVGSLWPAAGEGVNHLNALVAQTTHHTAATFAKVPMSHFIRHPDRPKNGRIIVFDVPRGGAAHLIDIGGSALLDSGRSDHFRYDILPTLTHLQIHPQSLIISHADSKHSGAMSQCLTRYRPKQAIIPRTDLRSPSYKNFLTQAPSSHCTLITPHSQQIFPLSKENSDDFLEILHAPVEIDGNGLADDTGLVLRLHWHGWRLLFTGDAGLITESRLLASGVDLRADVIIMGRNADDITGHHAFLHAVSPQVIISSHCDFPAAERIPISWKNHLTQQGIHLFDQQQSGAVTLTIDDNNHLILTPTLPAATPLTLKNHH